MLIKFILVVITYVESLTEKLQRIYRKHKIHAAVRHINTLKSILVHPKDKKDITVMWCMMFPVVGVISHM